MRYRELTETSLWLPRTNATASAATATIITLVDSATSEQALRRLADPASTGATDIEYIVVLDGEIKHDAVIRQCGAVSRIVHPRPLALPGLAAAEASARSSGGLLVFVQPHWLVDPAAIRDLAFAIVRDQAGWCMASIAGPGRRPLLRPLPRPELLDGFDPFDRLAFSIRRDALAVIGLPDPHIAFGPHWLWDFANRARRWDREMRFERPVAKSEGVAPYDPQIRIVPSAIIELSRTDRRDRLKPDRIADRNLIETSSDLWSMTNAQTQALALRRGWPTPPEPAGSTRQPPATDRPIVVYGDHDASVSLYFDGLPAPWSTKLRFVPMTQVEVDAACLAGAAAVILVRDVRHPMETGIVELLTTLGIPAYAFFDDNFTALAGEVPAFAYYTRENMAKALTGCAGLIATSPELANWFREECAISDPIVWPCVVDEALVPAAPSPDHMEFRVGMAGGPFRQSALASDISPALDAIADTHPVALWLRDDASAPTAARVNAVSFDVSFGTFIRRWRTFGLHALVHPRGDTANLRYKTPNALLVALYVGAVPVVEAEAAYEGLGEDDGVVVVRDGRAGWERALRRLIDPAYRGLMYERLQAACRRRFGDGAAVAALTRIAGAAPRMDAAEFNRRLPLLGQWLARRARSTWERDEWRPAPEVEPEPVSLRLFLRHPRKALIRMLTR